MSGRVWAAAVLALCCCTIRGKVFCTTAVFVCLHLLDQVCLSAQTSVTVCTSSVYLVCTRFRNLLSLFYNHLMKVMKRKVIYSTTADNLPPLSLFHRHFILVQSPSLKPAPLSLLMITTLITPQYLSLTFSLSAQQSLSSLFSKLYDRLFLLVYRYTAAFFFFIIFVFTTFCI